MGQDKRLPGCPAKVILLGSGILTLLLTSPGRRRRRGRSGETGARCFQHEVRRHPPGPHALALAAPRGLLSLLAASHVPSTSPGPFPKAPRGPSRPPAPQPSPPLRGLGPQRSHPQQTQVSETSGCQAGPAGAFGRPGQPGSVLARRATSRGTGLA